MVKDILDSLDRKILFNLDFNARASNSEIAKKSRTSKEVVGYRIKRLIDVGVIKGFYTIIDAARLGFMSCRFFIKLKNVSFEKEKEIISHFAEDKKYWWVDSIEGPFDLGVACWLSDLNDFHLEEIKFMEEFGEYIKTINQSIYVNFYIFKRAYFSNQPINDVPPIKISNLGKEHLDKKDSELLRFISSNARVPITDIAEKLNWSVGSIVHRLKNLEKKKIILTYRPLIDLSKIGRYWYKVNFTLKDHSKIDKIITFFNAHPDIVYAYETIGGPNLEMEAEVKSCEHFMEILHYIRSKFGDSIECYDHFLWYKEYKLTFFPEISLRT
ncbi:MAG: winged helix-turn-helix transcriptional regulator [Candidatus Diapherotrites archaeon]